MKKTKPKKQETPQLEPLCGDRQSNESDAAVVACNDYLRLGVGRSLAKLCDRYQNAPEAPPTRRLETLKDWSSKYVWQERSKAYDAILDAEKEARRREVMEEGFALDFERVLQLKQLAQFLIDEIYETNEKGVYHNVWLPDSKMIGSGETAEIIDLERFNAPLIEQLRKTLDDLAKETGGRIRSVKKEVTGKDGQPIQTTKSTVHIYIPDNGRGNSTPGGATDSVPDEPGRHRDLRRASRGR